jgi:hypothetical protein
MNIHDPIFDLAKDKLNAKSLAKIILHRLTDDDCPSTLGLYGGWGTGKTSTLNLIAEFNRLFQNPQELSNGPAKVEIAKNRFNALLQGTLDRSVTSSSTPSEKIEIPFVSKSLHIEIVDAWKYDTTNNLLTPIIVRLMKSLKGLNLSQYNDWRSYAERVLEVTSLAVSDIALRKLTGLTLGDVTEYKDNIRKTGSIADWEETIDHIENTNNLFTELVRLFLLQKNQQKLIICIDNLDRCSPENVVQLLESVKNYFAVINCTWVFVMDNSLISSYIDRKYEGTSMDGNSYLDKIIPEQYHVIQPTHAQATELLKGLLFKDIRLGDYAKISRFLVPRRLIKTAVKYEQAIKIHPSVSEGNKDTLFTLILLYHGWPDFYEFLSSGDDDHIIGTLINFYSRNNELKRFTQRVPLPDIFESDKELSYYVRSAFYQRLRSNLMSDEDALDAHFQRIIACIRALRYAGLP